MGKGRDGRRDGTRLGYYRPPLKWAGSKISIIEHVLAALPRGKRLIEPFLGSGAVFLNADYPSYLLNDNNRDLIGFYETLRDQREEFIEACATLFVDENNTAEAYYALRERYNETRPGLRRACLFLYLNRHGFNGLFRVNSKGLFNVPHGRYKRPRMPVQEMERLMVKLASADLGHGDFEATMEAAGKGDVVYCDPAYVPLSDTAYFTSYTSEGFGPEDQQRLADAARRASARGATVVISNHDVQFTREIYRGATIRKLQVRRHISRDAANRGHAPELLAIFKPG